MNNRVSVRSCSIAQGKAFFVMIGADLSYDVTRE